KEEYKFLEFKLRHLVHAIIDPEHKIDVIHRVVRFRDYPDEKSRNKVTLSNTPRKVNDLLSSYKESIESIEADGIHYETSIRNSSKEIELISKGLNETKLKLTSDQIMMIVSQAIKEGNSLNTVQVVIDSLGLTVKNGGIKVYDINNNLVLFVDDKSKKLIMSGFTLGTDELLGRYSRRIPDYTTNDLQMIMDYIMGKIKLTDAQYNYLNVYQDGYLSSRDYVIIENIISGKRGKDWYYTYKIKSNNSMSFIEYDIDMGGGYTKSDCISLASISLTSFRRISDNVTSNTNDIWNIKTRVDNIEYKMQQHGW
ncbi:MAG: dockerin, partial [Erysipelotrichaceae bacterium]